MSFFTFPIASGGAPDEDAEALIDEIFADAPDENTAQFAEITVLVRLKGGVTYSETPIKVESISKLLPLEQLAQHYLAEYPTITVEKTSKGLTKLGVVVTSEIQCIDFSVREVSINSEDQRRANGFHPPRVRPLGAASDGLDVSVPGLGNFPRQRVEGDQNPETD